MSTPALWRAPRALTPLDARVRLPGSKSMTNRALVLAALSSAPATIAQPLRSRDSKLMVAALSALGARIETSPSAWSVTPGSVSGAAAVDCGLAGTVMRFVPPVAALSTATVSFDGDPHARTRPMAPVLSALRKLGVAIDNDRNTLPFVVRGTGSVRGGEVDIDASASSQFVSGLLLAGPRFDQGVQVRHIGGSVPSAPHIAMTVDYLRRAGARVSTDGSTCWSVEPGPIDLGNVVIEPDLSNAGPFLALALTSRGRITIADWPAVTTQAGDRLRTILATMGAQVELIETGPDQTELRVTGGNGIHGIDVDLHEVGELTPVVAALCALAEGPSRLRGVAHIRGHETDRITALARELAGLGADVEEHDDGLAIGPADLHGGTFHTYADHRMAHAAVVIGSAVDGVEVEDVDTTAKTFPGFAEAWSGVLDPERPAADAPSAAANPR